MRYNDNMTTEQQIKILGIRLGLTLSDIADKAGMSKQSLSQKLKRDTFTPSELKQLAEKLGCKYQSAFILPDGDTISD